MFGHFFRFSESPKYKYKSNIANHILPQPSNISYFAFPQFLLKNEEAFVPNPTQCSCILGSGGCFFQVREDLLEHLCPSFSPSACPSVLRMSRHIRHRRSASKTQHMLYFFNGKNLKYKIPVCQTKKSTNTHVHCTSLHSV